MFCTRKLNASTDFLTSLEKQTNRTKNKQATQTKCNKTCWSNIMKTWSAKRFHIFGRAKMLYNNLEHLVPLYNDLPFAFSASFTFLFYQPSSEETLSLIYKPYGFCQGFFTAFFLVFLLSPYFCNVCGGINM